ncbi:MAG: glycosyltransferase [Paludibacteraceae bacterium]|nr:glycosyltransferase [Paludibacteraceae bacterium]
MVRMLAETCDVDLVYTCSKKTQPKDISPLYAYCKHVKEFTTSTFGMIIRGLLGFFSSKPLQCAYLYSSEAQKYINEHIPEYDFVFCNNVRAAQYVVGRKCTKIIDYVDALSMRYEKEMHKANLFAKIAFYIDAKRLARYESRILKEFQGHFIISDVDRQYILKKSHVSNKDIFVINNSTELRSSVTQNDEQNLVFVGSMFYEPNIVAVTSFVHKVFPKILKTHPNTKFYIVGTRPALSVRNLASDNVIVTGFVEDPQLYLKKATVVVVPMISGAGVQNKILEAMSMSCCVVTTTIGSEGLDNIVNNKDIIICDQYEQLAGQIAALIDDKARRNEIGRNARVYIAKNLTYDIISKQFTKDLKNMLRTN